jgi:hypothetical protein
MDFPHCSDCLQLENIALGHLTTIYSRLNDVNNCRSDAVETYKRPLEALHDSVSHALQPPKPTITACDADNTAISVNKNDNDNKENCATDL